MVSQRSVALDECYPIRLHGCFYLFLLYGFNQVFSHWYVDYAVCGIGSLFLLSLSFQPEKAPWGSCPGFVLVLF